MLCAARKPMRSFSSCRRLYPFLVMQRKELYMMRLASLMMMCAFIALQFYLSDSSNIFLNLTFHLRHWWEQLQTIFRSTSEQCTRRYGCFYGSCRLMLPINLQLYFLGNKVGKTLLSLVYPVLSYETWLLKKRRTLNNCKKMLQHKPCNWIL